MREVVVSTTKKLWKIDQKKLDDLLEPSPVRELSEEEKAEIAAKYGVKMSTPEQKEKSPAPGRNRGETPRYFTKKKNRSQ